MNNNADCGNDVLIDGHCSKLKVALRLLVATYAPVKYMFVLSYRCKSKAELVSVLQSF